MIGALCCRARTPLRNLQKRARPRPHRPEGEAGSANDHSRRRPPAPTRRRASCTWASAAAPQSRAQPAAQELAGALRSCEPSLLAEARHLPKKTSFDISISILPVWTFARHTASKSVGGRVKVSRRSVLRLVRGQCQGRSGVCVKVGRTSVSRSVGSMCQSWSEVVSRSVGRSSVSRSPCQRSVSHLLQRAVDLVLESNTLSNTGSGALI